LQISSTKITINSINHHKVIQDVLKISISLQSQSFDQPSQARTAATRCLEIRDRSITATVSQLLKNEVGLNPKKQGLTRISLPI
jgi:hypothetical protein